MRGVANPVNEPLAGEPFTEFLFGQQQLALADAFEWLARAPENSVHAVVTDPPYGLLEYQPEQVRKLRSGRGGVWRIPPNFDGAKRRPLPRFTVLGQDGRQAVLDFFERWGNLLLPVIRPGGYVFVAGNPLVSPLVAVAVERAGFERRGELVRLVRTWYGQRYRSAKASSSTRSQAAAQPSLPVRRKLSLASALKSIRIIST
jgi:site-specific DNA-methyltransferase (adenine-specific)